MVRPRLGVLFAVACSLTACELTEVTIVDFADIFIVEAKVTVAADPAGNSLRVFIHGTAPGSGPGSRTFDDARVTVVDGEGSSAVLALAPIDACVAILPENETGSCFTAGASLAEGYEAGEALTLDVELADGRRLSGSTTIPGGFDLAAVGGTCLLTPDTRLPLEWTRSEGARAYVSEALIVGLAEALADEGIEAPDTLYLVGLSISESDTTVSFPDQFGVFDRFDLDRDLAIRLQVGLPEGTSAEIAITALDENETNWARGGNFNPSGAVRVSSLAGDGSGAFGSAVTRRFTIVSSADTTVAPGCTQP
jgi:hypothetical protein